MTNRDLLIREVEALPESVIGEILEYVKALRERTKLGDLETALASESSLKKDWLRPKEDEAWKDL